MGVTDPYERITWRGVTLNRRTAAMMEKAQKRFGRPFDSIPQGSYCTCGALVAMCGSGHFPPAGDPVRVNLLIKQFADRVAP
jgi:hypothetical protein